MSTIAVAGGTGGLGRAIVDGLNAAGKSTVVVLSRESTKEKEKELGARMIAVDYNDVASVSAVLEKNNIDTVICTLSTPGPEAELALISAVEKSRVTNRYIPAIWTIPYNSEMIPYFPPAGSKLQVLAALEKTSLQYTAFYNGFFLDYFVPGVPTYLRPLTWAVDVQNNAASIPGTGDVPVVLTHTSDVAKFVAAYMEKPNWDKEAYIIGNRLTLNELIRLVEEAKGVKFTVTYDSVDDLSAGKVTELPSHPPAYAVFPKEALQGFLAGFGLLAVNGALNLKPERTLNQDFGSIKPQTVKELLALSFKA
ncbi:NmrA-like domain [Fusarium oxysporum f. sp. vasinfectum]|nr:NmrA-like domain [Fusarium oxysporum f. sp. vasinfectum]